MTPRIANAWSRRSGNVVSDLSAILLVIIAIVGLWDDRPWITFVCALVLIVTVVARYWTKIALTEIRYTAEPSVRRVVEGGTFELSILIENNKPIPLPWIQVLETIPAGLVLADDTAGEVARTFNGGTEINETVGIGAFERAHLKVALRATRRGHFTFGPARLRSGDIFGFYRNSMTLQRSETDLVVFPRTVRLPAIPVAASRPIGDTLLRHSYTEDVTRPRSLREFRSGDSPRRIDWKSSAKRGELFVRTYDPSINHCVVLAVECETNTRGHWSVDTGLLEDTIRTAATVALRYARAGYRLGLICNGTPMSGATPPVLPPATGKAQLLEMMNCLAAASVITTRGIGTLAESHGPSAAPHGASILYVASALRENALAFLRTAQAKGSAVKILYTGREDPTGIEDLALIDHRPAFGRGKDDDKSEPAKEYA